MAVRGTHELAHHRTSSFLTLTIRDVALRAVEPDCPRGSTEAPDAPSIRANIAPVDYVDSTAQPPRLCVREGTGPSLSIRDHQLFMKRLLFKLRSYGPIEPVRLIMCGEYGDKKFRPHYHYILFGYGFPDKYPFKKKNGHQLYRSALLEECWPHGQADIGLVTFNSINYVTGYITKKITGKNADDHYRRQTPNGTTYYLQPEFTCMSRRPGIGAGWFGKNAHHVYPADRVVINGKAAKPPRYYDKKLEQSSDLLYEQVKKARELKLAQQDPANYTPERLRAGETILHARLNQKKRSLE